MEKRVSLVALFDLIEADLTREFRLISLPQDLDKLENVLKEIFTQRIDISQYYEEISPVSLGVLQHCFRIIAVQNKLLSCFEFNPIIGNAPYHKTSVSQNIDGGHTIRTYINDNKEVVATLVGGILGGGWILSSWGSILIATIGCAIVKYYNNISNLPSHEKRTTQTVDSQVSLNVKLMVDTIRDICRQMDDLMQYVQDSIDIYRKKNEIVPEVSLDNTFPDILDCVKSLFLSYNKEKSIDKLKEKIQNIFETLENYGYKIVEYSEEFAHCFSIVESPHIHNAQTSKPAVLKGEKILEKGRYLIPSNNVIP